MINFLTVVDTCKFKINKTQVLVKTFFLAFKWLSLAVSNCKLFSVCFWTMISDISSSSYKGTGSTGLRPDLMTSFTLNCLLKGLSSKQSHWGFGINIWILGMNSSLNMPANLENSAVATGLVKINFHSNLKKGNIKECSNYCKIALISHVSKVMLNIL